MKETMKNITIRIIAGFLLLTFAVSTEVLQAQKKAKKVPVIEVTAQVTDENGQPIRDAVVIAGEGAITRYTDALGKFAVQAKQGSAILIEAFGYKDYVLRVDPTQNTQTIRLEAEEYLAGERDILSRLDGGQTTQRDLTAAIGRVDMEKVRSYADLNVTNGLQGQAAGLIVRSNDGGLGYNGSDLYVRGLHAAGTEAIVVIDGIERPLDDLTAEEIESIEVLKDAPAKVLYGPRAANGVVLVTTKRGEANKRIIRATLEYGVNPSTRVPKFLGAYDYVTLYNEARQNDGLPDLYQPWQLEGYKNSQGVSDLLFPNVDWYNYFVRDMNNYRKAILELNGGNDNVRYALTAGYTGGSGLENVGKRSDLNRLNVRGNLDIRITDYLTVAADVAARLEIKKWGGKDGAGVYSDLSTNKPNEYPLTINPDDIGMEPNEDGSPYYGTSIRKTNNLLVDMAYGGETQERYVNSQTNLGVKFDFDKYVKGLFADAYITFDNYNYLRQALTKTFATYAVDPYLDETGQIAKRVTQMKKINQSDDINIASEATTRTLGWRANVGYKREIGVHAFSGVAAFRYYKDEVRGDVQNCVTTNFTTRLNYSYDRRYLAEMTFGLMGSNQLAKENRYCFSPVGSVAWILSNESFLKGVKGVEFLKLKASYGRLGFNSNSNYLLYKTGWVTAGTYGTGEANKTSVRLMNLSRVGNPDLDWVTSTELNVGLEGIFLGGRLQGEVNFFREVRKGIIGQNTTAYSSLIGPYLMYENVQEVLNRGVDAYVTWNGADRTGAFRYSVGVNFTYTKNRIEKMNELSNIEEYRKATGRPTSAIFGLVSEGLFGRDVALEGHAKQNFGPYGIGDIAYRDLNNDGNIDTRDNKMIGQTFPVTTWGIHADFNYKGFGLYLLATAETGASALLNNDYYWNRGENSYSVLALDRYHPVNNPTGSYPRLTTTTGENNFRDTDFWVEDASFLRLKNVELSYTLTNKKLTGFCKQCKFFVRGTNLFVLSKIKDLDPERLNAGLTNYPVYRTFTGGLSITF